MSTEKTGKKELHKILKVIEEFRKLDPQMRPQTMATFLYVALHEGVDGVPQKDLADAIGIAQSTTSRNVSTLDKINRHHGEGHRLIRSVEDPLERRRKLITLTPRGRQLKATLEEMLAA
jgi:DNA-binding MarR family transcriptional regulator